MKILAGLFAFLIFLFSSNSTSKEATVVKETSKSYENLGEQKARPIHLDNYDSTKEKRAMQKKFLKAFEKSDPEVQTAILESARKLPIENEEQKDEKQ